MKQGVNKVTGAECSRKIRYFTALFTLLISLNVNQVLAWVDDPIVNTPVAETDYPQIQPDIIADGKGGTFIVWRDDRDGTNNDIYAQHLDGNGKPLWVVNGIKVADTSGHYPRIVRDGGDGVIVAWLDQRSDFAIYAQRINAAGVTQWPVNGIVLDTPSTKSRDQLRLIEDGVGGAIATWSFDFGAGDYDVYAQRIDADGDVQWGASALAISVSSNSEYDPQLVSDGAGGAYFVWEDSRNASLDIFAQRVTANGTLNSNWAGGLAIDLESHDQYRPQIVTDGQGGMIVAFLSDHDNGTNVYAVRVKSDDTVPWVTNRTIAASSNERRSIQVAADGSGGIVAAWWENRSGSTTAMYAQRLDSDGTTQWPVGSANGVRVSHTDSNKLVPDTLYLATSNKAFVVAWVHERVSMEYNFYAQKLSSSGGVLWSASDVLVGSGIAGQYQAFASDGTGGALLAFSRDSVSPGVAGTELYAQRVYADGKLIDGSMCIPIKTAGGKVAIVCL